jgi:uncharacterized membrane protein
MEILLLFVIGYVAYLHSQLTGIRNDIKSLQNKSQNTAPEIPVSAQAQTTVPEAAQAATTTFAPQTQNAVITPAPEPAFITWVKEDFFVKLGALLLLIAFGWFVNYAFANDWIGPMGRITLGLGTGVLILFLGVWRIQTHKQQGGIFTVLGSAVVILTTFAAREVYDFFTPATALMLMSLSVIFVAFVSVRYHSEKIAIASLLLAAVAPFMTNSTDPSSLTLFSYWLVMVVGTLWVVKVTASNTLTALALLITGFYSAPLILGYGVSSEDKLIGLLFSFVFTAVFFIANIVSIAHKKTDTAKQGHTITALLTGLYLVSWIGFAAPEQWQSMLYIAWMLVFSMGAFAVYIHTNNRAPFYIYSAVGVGLLAAATAAELDGPLLTIAYSVELMILMFVLATVLKDHAVTFTSSLLFIGLGLSSLWHIDPYLWRDGFMHAHFAALLCVTVAFFSAASLLFRTKNEGKTSQVPIVLTIIGLLYSLLLVWLVTHSVLVDDSATTVSLIIYTLLGITLFVKGKIVNSTVVTVVGALLLGSVVARLLFVDIWQMDIVGRVVTFGAIGILLISTAFIGKKKN